MQRTNNQLSTLNHHTGNRGSPSCPGSWISGEGNFPRFTMLWISCEVPNRTSTYLRGRGFPYSASQPGFRILIHRLALFTAPRYTNHTTNIDRGNFPATLLQFFNPAQPPDTSRRPKTPDYSNSTALHIENGLSSRTSPMKSYAIREVPRHRSPAKRPRLLNASACIIDVSHQYR